MSPLPNRTAAVRQALARYRRTAHMATELELLTRYAMGQLTLEQANHQLRAQGLAMRLA